VGKPHQYVMHSACTCCACFSQDGDLAAILLAGCSGVVKGQVAHTLGAWMLAKALLDTHAPLALPTPIKAAAAALRFSVESDEDDDQQDLTDAMLIDTGFLAKRNLGKDIAAAADEGLDSRSDLCALACKLFPLQQYGLSPHDVCPLWDTIRPWSTMHGLPWSVGMPTIHPCSCLDYTAPCSTTGCYVWRA